MSGQPVRLAVAGAAGRMGRCVLELAAVNRDFDIVAALVLGSDPACGGSLRMADCEVRATDRLESPCDVLIDFTLPSGTMAWVEVCREKRTPMVIGSTGHDDTQLAAIRDAARDIAIVQASNFSVGIQTLLGIIGRVAADLGSEYDIEIVEMHHRNKVDAPSGTAKAMLEAIREATGGDPSSDAIYGRHGEIGPRPSGTIGVHAVRLGEIIGKHEIHFSGPGETLTITHTAHARTTFAAGALRAARWVVDRPAGLYAMADVTSVSAR